MEGNKRTNNYTNISKITLSSKNNKHLKVTYLRDTGGMSVDIIKYCPEKLFGFIRNLRKILSEALNN